MVLASNGRRGIVSEGRGFWEAHSRSQSAISKRAPMTVSLKPASDVAANYADNLCRWNRRSANHYEVWFLTLNQRAARRGFWFRYCIEAPVNAAPQVALWAAAFDRANAEANLGIKQEYA